MILFLLAIAAVLLYGKSKYFPKRWQSKTEPLRRNKKQTRSAAYVLSMIAAIAYIWRWDVGTGLIVWLFALTLTLSLVLIFVPLGSWLAERRKSHH